MSGTGTAAATAIILIGVVIGLILAEPSLEDAMDDLRETREDNSERSLNLANTRVELASANFNNTTKTLNFTVRNTGSSVLEVKHLDLLVNGTWNAADFGGTEYIYPADEVLASIKNVSEPVSVKVVTRFGISDQTSEISN
jgi:archaellum component FlaF (FlaF/FlaG flagellin family)